MTDPRPPLTKPPNASVPGHVETDFAAWFRRTIIFTVIIAVLMFVSRYASPVGLFIIVWLPACCAVLWGSK